MTKSVHIDMGDYNVRIFQDRIEIINVDNIRRCWWFKGHIKNQLRELFSADKVRP